MCLISFKDWSVHYENTYQTLIFSDGFHHSIRRFILTGNIRIP